MYVVTVEFELVPEHAGAFLAEAVANATMSRTHERGCRQFDVCTRPGDPAYVFLYELYDDRAAFDAHLSTEHFRAFDAATAQWVAKKTIRAMERLDP